MLLIRNHNQFMLFLLVFPALLAAGLICLPAMATSATNIAHASPGLSEHSVLLLFLDLAVLLLGSLVCGEVMVRLGQPAIIGQILAGVLLGQTVFGNFFPAQSAWLFPKTAII